MKKNEPVSCRRQARFFSSEFTEDGSRFNVGHASRAEKKYNKYDLNSKCDRRSL